MLIAMVPYIDVKALQHSLKRPISLAPLLLVALAVLGTLWSDVPWGARLYAIGPTAKLLVLPALFYHFERSERGLWVFIAFLTSCVLMALMSSLVAFNPTLALKAHADRGIFVKNYIDQGQEFSLCAVALAYPIANLLSVKRRLSVLLLATMILFLTNMVFVVTSRTALVTMPVMLAVFGLIHLRWRANLGICARSSRWALPPGLLLRNLGRGSRPSRTNTKIIGMTVPIPQSANGWNFGESH